METLKQQMQQRYHLESARIQQTGALRETEESIPAARRDLREKQQEKILYEGSLKHLLHRLTGKAEEEQERRRRDVRAAEGALDRLVRMQESLKQDIGELTAELEGLPCWESFPQSAEEEVCRLWAQLEGKLCAQELIPLLEKVDAALEDYRGLLRGERMGEITGTEAHFERTTAHIALAEDCAPLLRRMERASEMLEIPFSPGGYFQNPGGFVDSAAARHNRIDRVSTALGQVMKMRREAEKFL